MQSENAAQQFDDNSVDLVFLDGDHSYSGVKNDINFWWHKVKKGGVLGGHDYSYPNIPFGVKQAVDEFVTSNGLLLELDHDYCWFVRKQ